ncbi:MAG: DUF2251 domain-containing protein [Pseudomonadota bacterium]|nr:DUF2251 domain-containing protein [Pseudomonadota bacterium]
MAIFVTAKQNIRIGNSKHVEGKAPEGNYSAVFEDDGNTGYFYALDYSRENQPIQNALHIYDVASITDKHLPSEIKIGWSMDSNKVVLLINEYPHAVFDFFSKRGYCRNEFPPPTKNSGWSGHEWSDESIELFAGDP